MSETCPAPPDAGGTGTPRSPPMGRSRATNPRRQHRFSCTPHAPPHCDNVVSDATYARGNRLQQPRRSALASFAMRRSGVRIPLAPQTETRLDQGFYPLVQPGFSRSGGVFPGSRLPRRPPRRRDLFVESTIYPLTLEVLSAARNRRTSTSTRSRRSCSSMVKLPP